MFDAAAYRKRAMQEQDARMQTSTMKTTGSLPAGGYCSEPETVRSMGAPKVTVTNHATRRRQRHAIAKAMAVYAR